MASWSDPHLGTDVLAAKPCDRPGPCASFHEPLVTSMAPGKNKTAVSSPSKLTSGGVPMVGLVLVTRHCDNEWLSMLSV